MVGWFEAGSAPSFDRLRTRRARPLEGAGRERARPFERSGRERARPFERSGRERARPLGRSGRERARPFESVGQGLVRPAPGRASLMLSLSKHEAAPIAAKGAAP